jgi:hypothetical protein
MSKMDLLRAMREARYEAAQKRTGAAASPPTVKAEPATGSKPAAKPKPKPAAVEPEAAAGEALCGHRNMSGRTCTREHGHAAKSHRYS